MITDAFHGIVFSIIFNKDFFCEISNYGRDTGSRITNILKIYGLEDRLINSKKYEECLKAQKIDWYRVNEIIEKEQKDAQYHIRKMLGNIA